MRRAARKDGNESEIVGVLRDAGATVWIIQIPVDLLIGFNGRTALAEVKILQGKKNPRAADYTDLQVQFMQSWNGGTVATLTDVESALRLLKVMSHG
jgi:hypothetical protein